MDYLQKAILTKYKQHWHTLRDAGFIKNLDKTSVEEIESAYKSLIDTNFFVNKWCMSCVAEMIRILYTVAKFDELESNEKFFDVVTSTDGYNLKTTDDSLIRASIATDEQIEKPKPQPKKRGRKKKS